MRKYDDVEDCSHCLEKQRSKLKEAAAREHKHEHENMSVSMSTSAADLNAIKSGCTSVPLSDRNLQHLKYICSKYVLGIAELVRGWIHLGAGTV